MSDQYSQQTTPALLAFVLLSILLFPVLVQGDDCERVPCREPAAKQVNLSYLETTYYRQPSIRFQLTEHHVETVTAASRDGNWFCRVDGEEGFCVPEQALDDGPHTVTLTFANETTAWNRTASIHIDTRPPTISCQNCSAPSIVGINNRILFAPNVTDLNGNVTVKICGEYPCIEPYCTFNTDRQDFCVATVPDTVYPTNPYWIVATDVVGNTAVHPAADRTPHAFIAKKNTGMVCLSNDNCLRGTCNVFTCSADDLSPPSAQITLMTEQPIHALSQGETIIGTIVINNPLPVPDLIRVSLTGAGVASSAADELYAPDTRLYCVRGDDCFVSVAPRSTQDLLFSIRTGGYGRGRIEVGLRSTAGNLSSRTRLDIGVRDPLLSRIVP